MGGSDVATLAPLNCGMGRNNRNCCTVGPFSCVARGSVMSP